MNRRIVSLIVLFFWLASGFGFPAVTGAAATSIAPDRRLPDDESLAADLSGIGAHLDDSAGVAGSQVGASLPSQSLDRDYDGLTDDVETEGWRNAAGSFTTDPLDPDSDDDGLNDGEEKLYDTDPLDDHSPGIYVEYEGHLKTREYSAKNPHSKGPWGWQQYGDRLITFDAVVVRRGSSFSVGGPADATIRVLKSTSSLTTIPFVRDACNARWRLSVPSGGTVGRYQIVVEDGGWSRRLDLYIIFELPTPTSGFTQDMIEAFLYDDDPDDMRDETGILLNSYGMEYTHDDQPWRIPEGEFTAAGDYYTFDLQQFEPFVFEEHVMRAINGYRSQSGAASSLVARADRYTRFNNPRPLTSSWATLHPGADDSNQCSNIAGLVAAFARGAGIPSRPVFVDWRHASFDHATEIWLYGSWQTARGYRQLEPEGCLPNCGYGHYPPQTRSSWGRQRYRPWHSGGGGRSSVVASADEYWPLALGESHEYRWPSWDWDTIVRRSWVQTLFVPYWGSYGWWREPRVIGTPPDDWPSASRSALTASSESQAVEPGGELLQETAVELVVRGTGDDGIDLDGDGYFDQLVIETQVDADVPGTYWMQAELGVDRQSPGLNEAGGLIASTVVRADLVAGTNTVQLPFDGLRISAAKVDGPYVLKYLSVTNVDSPEPDDFVNDSLGYWVSLYTTSAYRARDFQNRGALLSGPIAERGLDADADGRYEALILDVALDVFEPGTYTVEGYLHDAQGEFVGHATWTGTDATASLQFDALPGSLGPYTLEELYLLDARQEIIDSSVDAYTTAQVVEAEGETHIVSQAGADTLRPWDEAMPQGVLPGTVTDAGRDLDDDGLYDLLVVDLEVLAHKADLYRLEGWLVGADGALVTWASSEPISLTEGTHPMSLTFGGPAINAHRADGPFTLVTLKLLGGDGYTVLDSTPVAYTSLAYTYDQFDSLPYLELPGDHVRLLEDRMDDGADGWTPDAPWALITTESNSPAHAWTDSPGGSYGDNADVSLTTVPMSTGGVGWPTLKFHTCYNLEGDYDYGYVEVSTNAGLNWTRVSTYTGRTVHWSGETVDLGIIGDVEALQIRFRLATDAGGTRDGWYVDDVLVYFDQDLDDDGIPNGVEVGDDLTDPVDTDADSTPDYLDTDADADGIPDQVEAGDDPADPVDTDADATPDYQDTDADADGIPDAVEAGDDPANPVDTDADGLPDYRDPDSDGDGIPDEIEAGSDPADPVDTDADGTPDYLDDDADGDGIPDEIEAGDDPADPVDTDGDGTPDYLDDDADADGIPDSVEGSGDVDGDGVPNFQDPDSDGDGIPDEIDPEPIAGNYFLHLPLMPFG